MDFVSPTRMFGQAVLVRFPRARRRLSPASSMRWALWTRRSNEGQIVLGVDPGAVGELLEQGAV
jgi:hypothetical protein